MKLNTELTAGPVVNIAVVLGINLVSAGSGVAFDAATGDFIKYNAESNVAHANLIASRILKTEDSGSVGCADILRTTFPLRTQIFCKEFGQES